MHPPAHAKQLRGRLVLLGAAALALVAAACSSSSRQATPAPSTGSSSSATTLAPKAGGTLNLLYSFTPLQMDPLVASASGSAGDAPYEFALYDALSYIQSDTGKIVYQTAESLTPDASNATWTLKLHPNIQFSDGTPYDAAAVQFNWQRIANPANSSSNLSIASQIASMNVVDPVTLQITLKSPNSHFANNVAVFLPYIGSPTAIKSEGAQFGSQPVGAGPYILQEWVRGNQVTFARNPHYWKAPLPYLDQLIIHYVADDQQRLNTFTAGQAQVAFMNLRSDLAQKAINSGTKSSLAESSGGVVYMLNETKPPFSSLAARQAFASAINYDLLNQTVFSGANSVPTSYFGSNSPYYNKSLTAPAYDPAKAQSLFDQAAKELGGPVQFTLNATPANTANAEFVQAEVNQFKNVSMTLKTLTGAQVVPLVSTGNYQASTNQITMFDPDPALYNFVESKSTQNFMHFSDPVVDAALAMARTSSDPAVWKAQYDIVQQELYQKVPFIMFTRPRLYFLLQKNVQGFVNSNNMVLSDRIWLG